MALDDDDDDDDVYVENNCRIPGQSIAIPLKQWLGGYVAAWPLSCAPSQPHIPYTVVARKTAVTLFNNNYSSSPNGL